MFARYRALLAQTRASYTPAKAAEERANEMMASVLYRPVSFWVTPPFLALGWTADHVSVLQMALAAAMPVVAWWRGGLTGSIVVLGLALMIQVLDCVDGNVARVSKRNGVGGGMMEGLCTLLFWTCYFITVGLLARGGPGWLERHAVSLGLALAVMLLAQREAEDTFDAYCGERVRWSPPVVERSRFAWLPKFAEQACAFGGLFLAAYLGWLHWFLAALAVYQTSVFVLWLPRYARALAVRMRPPLR